MFFLFRARLARFISLELAGLLVAVAILHLLVAVYNTLWSSAMWAGPVLAFAVTSVYLLALIRFRRVLVGSDTASADEVPASE